MKDRKGFSLIELIAIIVIIGLILIVAIPAVTLLLKNNNNKQYEQYLEVVRAGGLRYSEEAKDDLGGYNDTGCIEVTLEELIEEELIKEYNEKDITCTGSVRLNNVKGNVSGSVNLTCKNERNVTTYEVNEINDSDCVAYIPGDGGTSPGGSTSNVTLVDAILRDNEEFADNVESTYVSASTGIDFSRGSSYANGNGLYYTSTNTENNQRTYYYRGDIDNNYVKFGKDSSGNDILWRIVRINEDGSIRIITQDSVGNSAFNENYDDNAYVGYMYGTAGSSTYDATHANKNDSTIKDYLDEWYTDNLSRYSSYLADAGFCNDRSLGNTGNGAGGNATYYGSSKRLWTNKTPQFACPQTKDLFTTTTSSKGNKALTNPIGLLTIDEISYAGGRYSTTNSSMYLTNGSEYWTMSPFYYNGYTAFGWSTVSINSRLDSNPLDSEYGVRPVINLNSTVITTSGNGSYNSPYTVELAHDEEVVWTLGGTNTGTGEMKEPTSALSIKPVITISKDYIEGGISTPDEGGLGGSGSDDNQDAGDNKEDVNNPETGDNIIILACATLILASIAVYTYKKRKIHS